MATEQAHLQRVIDYYSLAQPFYRLFWHGSALGLHYGFWKNGVSNHKEAIIKENEVLADLAEVKAGDLVLDAGCGIGGSGIWLAQERNAKVIGLNVVHKQLTYAKSLSSRRNLNQAIRFVEGDYQQLPLFDQSVDVYWALESIEHATNIEVLLGEAGRVLKPGGRIVIAGTFKGREILSEEEQRQLNVGLGVAGCFNDFKTAEDTAFIMNSSGFEDIRILDMTSDVMNSARRLTRICKLGLPIARAISALHRPWSTLVANNEWGTYQEGLFRTGATAYKVLAATKPESN